MKDLSNNIVDHKSENGKEFLQFKRLLQYADIKHLYTLNPDNYKITKLEKIELEDKEKIIKKNENATENFIQLKKWFGADAIVLADQTHSSNVKSVVEAKSIDLRDTYEETDGLITNMEKVAISTTNADCILFLFYDPNKKVIGSVHSGWKGTVQKISVNAINKMVQEFNCNPKDIICCICPSIRKCHFEVEKEVKDIFFETFNYMEQINKIIEYKGKKDGVDKWVIDTVQINKILLKQCGLLEENIEDCGICSVCNCDKIHSFRIEKQDYSAATATIMKI